MKIVVLVKEVPDTYGDRKIDLETGLADRGASEPVMDEICERSLEFAIRYAEKNSGTEVVALAMAPESAEATIRKALALGADSGIQIVDDRLVGADLGTTAQTLAAELRRIDFDLIVTGNKSTDGGGGVMAAMLAELLRVPGVTNLDSVTLDGSGITASRAIEGGTQDVAVGLPAVISITERMPEARFPSFKGITSAKKKQLEKVTLADLGVDPDDEGEARSIVVGAAQRLARSAGVKIIDEGDGGAQLAAFLIENRLA